MNAAVLHAIRDIRLEQLDVPSYRDDEVLVQVEVVGVCGSDLHYYAEGRSGSSFVSKPTVIGHEFAGTIVAAGIAVDENRIGERVAVEPGIACRRCSQCVAGRYNLCENMYFLGAAPIGGAMAEYIAVPARNAYAIPANLTSEAAAMIEPLSVAMWATERGGVVPGKRLLITGAGPIGLLAAQMSYVRGARQISIIDTNPQRLILAQQLGPFSTYSPDEWQTSGAGVDVLIECTGAPAALQSAVGSLAPASSVVLVGVGPETVTLPMTVLQDREVTVTGSYRYRNTWPAAIELAASGSIQLDMLVTDRFSLADAALALSANLTNSSAVKVIINPQEYASSTSQSGARSPGGRVEGRK